MKKQVHDNGRIEHHGTSKGEENPLRQKGRRRKLSKPEVDSLLAMYRGGEKTTAEIAACFGVTPSSVTNIAKRAGLTLRSRGGRARVEPSPAVQMMLLEAWTNTYAIAAARFGLTRQRIGQLAKRWEAWAIAEFGPRNIRPEEGREETETNRQRLRPVRSHVISFRVSDSEMTELLARGGRRFEPWARSPHSAARFLLLRFLENPPNRECEPAATIGSES